MTKKKSKLGKGGVKGDGRVAAESSWPDCDVQSFMRYSKRLLRICGYRPDNASVRAKQTKTNTPPSTPTDTSDSLSAKTSPGSA